ncbi:MAG: hypothetical protein V2B18_06475 [Pseudomonadota bacterium]
MCTEGVSHLLMDDARIGRALSDPGLDLVHKQVMMALYSLADGKRLDRYKEMLPIYLSLDWDECDVILDAIVQAGLLRRTEEGLELVYPITRDHTEHSCGCHG